MGNVREASKENYKQRLLDGTHSEQTQKVYNYIKDRQGGCTGNMIAKALDMPTATVSGIVRPMEKAGVVYRTEERFECPVTKRRVHWIRRVTEEHQLTLI